MKIFIYYTNYNILQNIIEMQKSVVMKNTFGGQIINDGRP